MVELAKQTVICTNRSKEIVRDSCTTKRKEKTKKQQQQQQSMQLTSTVTDEVTLSPVSGGSSLTGGSLIGGASSEPALPIKSSTYCHCYTSINSTGIYAIWEWSCQRFPKDLSIVTSIGRSAIHDHLKLMLQSNLLYVLVLGRNFAGLPRQTKTFPRPKLESTLLSLKKKITYNCLSGRFIRWFDWLWFRFIYWFYWLTLGNVIGLRFGQRSISSIRLSIKFGCKTIC